MPVHSFRSATPPALAASGNPLICVNTVAWDHGTATSAPPYVQVGDTKYDRASSSGIQAVVLNRQNLALIPSASFTDPLWKSVEDGGVGLYQGSFFWN